MRKNEKYRVHYSVFVNGTEYPKDLPYDAPDEQHAEEQLKKQMRSFPESEYKITKTVKVS